MPEPDAAHPDSGSDRPAAGALGLRPDWWLVIASSLEYLAISISTQASNQLWLDRFGGDYAAQARVMGRLSSGAAVLGLFLRPLVAQSSDIFGRKPLLLLAYGLQTLLKGGIAAAPEQLRLPLLALSQYLLGFVTWESSMFTISAAIGDMLSEADSRTEAGSIRAWAKPFNRNIRQKPSDKVCDGNSNRLRNILRYIKMHLTYKTHYVI